MELKFLRNIKIKPLLIKLFNPGILRNIIFMFSGMIVFIIGVLIYGIILNLRQVPLLEAMRKQGFEKLDNVNLIIDRSSFTLKLYEDTVLIKSYRASFGRNLHRPKTAAGDGATPVGKYKICKIDTVHKYHKFLRIDYPNLEDAAEALRKGLISQAEYDKLQFDYYYGECPGAETVLGGNIGIHGIGRLNYILKNLPFVYNWTDGSVALSNEDIDEITSVIKKGTRVVIR
ncbi:MAG: hypothetical protein Kow0098_15680 [Ignavibacteriaceae bacterium]